MCIYMQARLPLLDRRHTFKDSSLIFYLSFLRSDCFLETIFFYKLLVKNSFYKPLGCFTS
jgi:hypothetical protein